MRVKLGFCIHLFRMCGGDGGAAHGHGEGEDADLWSPLLWGGAVCQVIDNTGCSQQ